MQKPYKILGIDPGTNLLGYSIIQIQDQSPKMLTMGVISLRKFPDHQSKLKEIYLQLQEIIETYLPKFMAIEAPFFGKNVQSMLKLGRAQGVAMAAAITMGVPITEYSPKKIKMSITGNGNASKEQVAAMLNQIFSVPIKTNQLDATDALAVALCHHYQKHQLDKSNNFKDWSSFVKANPGKVKK
jgi:crossover junction endodeoxyribonuclease RuvC